jgi:integrase
LRIIASKFNTSREIALHPSTVEALDAYRRQRDRRWPRPATTGFFVSSRGSRLAQSSLEVAFARLVDQAGLAPPPGSRGRRQNDTSGPDKSPEICGYRQKSHHPPLNE